MTKEQPNIVLMRFEDGEATELPWNPKTQDIFTWAEIQKLEKNESVDLGAVRFCLFEIRLEL